MENPFAELERREQPSSNSSSMVTPTPGVLDGRRSVWAKVVFVALPALLLGVAIGFLLCGLLRGSDSSLPVVGSSVSPDVGYRLGESATPVEPLPVDPSASVDSSIVDSELNDVGDIDDSKTDGRISTEEAPLDPRFTYCYEAVASGYGDYVNGIHPEYEWYDDRDNDGIVCER